MDTETVIMCFDENGWEDFAAEQCSLIAYLYFYNIQKNTNICLVCGYIYSATCMATRLPIYK